MEHAMFLSVLTVALFILTVATGGSAAGSCTASLPSLVGVEEGLRMRLATSAVWMGSLNR